MERRSSSKQEEYFVIYFFKEALFLNFFFCLVSFFQTFIKGEKERKEIDEVEKEVAAAGKTRRKNLARGRGDKDIVVNYLYINIRILK